MTPVGRWRNLGAAAGAMTAVLFAAFDLYQWALAYAGDRFHDDFTFYYAAARVGLAHGWASIYDLQLLQVELDAIGSGIKTAQLARFISPPPLAWTAIPFTALPYPAAYWTWSALLVIALGFTWWWAAPGTGPWRLVHLAAAIGWLPVIYGLQLGQPGLLVALGVAGCYALLKAERPFLAGLAVCTLAFKPQLALLVPPALLISGRTRAFWGSVVALGPLAIASAVALGPGGLSAYEGRLSFAASLSVNRELTLAPLVGSLAATRVIQGVIVLWALALAYRFRGRTHEWVLVPALVGGMLASPYVHLDDLVMLGLAGWLYLRTSPPAWTSALVLAVVIACEGVTFWGPLPLLAGELAAMVLLSVSSVASGAAREPAGAVPRLA